MKALSIDCSSILPRTHSWLLPFPDHKARHKLLQSASNMAPRLAHTKSRNGCLRCKQRKVKCDENRPSCLSCSRHHVKCQYPTKSPTTVKSPTTDSEPDLDKLLTSEQRRQLELQLLHYFGSTMVWTLGSSTSLLGRETWAHTAIELSFKYPFLQTSIYAFAALYILQNTPQSRRYFAPVDMQQAAARAIQRKIEVQCPLPMSTVHELYLDLGLRQQREAVGHLDAESVNAVFLSTLLFWYQAAPQVASEMPEGGYAPPLRWLRMVRPSLLLYSSLCVDLVVRSEQSNVIDSTFFFWFVSSTISLWIRSRSRHKVQSDVTAAIHCSFSCSFLCSSTYRGDSEFSLSTQTNNFCSSARLKPTGTSEHCARN